MKRLYFSFFILLLFIFTEAYPATSHPEKEKSLEQLKEFHQRGGLPNFFWKISRNREVRVGYFGGSITAAGDGWRDLTCNWLRVNFPQTIFRQTNGAIGGTGSDLGVFRIEKDILQDKPDLVFVEFAVNDGGHTRESILETMEGIVRKIWQADPLTDICFVYTVSEGLCSNLIDGKIHPTVMAMEELAEYYGIPGIHLGMEIARLQKEGKLVFTADPAENTSKIVFTRDHVHPLSESGHPLYAATVAKYFAVMQKSTVKKLHVLPDPFVSNPWTEAKMVDLSGVALSDGWQKLPSTEGIGKQFASRMPVICQGSPGCHLQFRFKGTALGLYDIIGPGTGLINLRIDGQGKKVLRFDRHCSYYRLANTILVDNLKDTIHEVEIEVLGENPEKSKILLENHLEKFKEDPAFFSGNDYYLGNLLIVGDLIEN